MSENDEPTLSTIEQEGDDLELLTVPQVARLFNVPEKWVYAKAASGDLPSAKIGVYRRFRRGDLRRFLQAPTDADTSAIDQAGVVRRPRKRRSS